MPLAFILVGCWLFSLEPDGCSRSPLFLSTYHYNQQVIALTHLLVLGWICSVVMGAIYQLAPVSLETTLFSEKLAVWHLVFHVVGFTGMVCMFRVWNVKFVGQFAVVLAVGVGLFVYNIVRTLCRAPRWNVTATAISSSLLWLSFAVLAGLSIAAGKCAYDS